MKKLLVIMLSLGLALGASAQRGHFSGGHAVYYHSAPRVAVGVGFGIGGYYSPFYSPFYSPYYYPYYGFGYPFYGYPMGSAAYSGSNSYKLNLQIQDIQNDYKNRISEARHDETLTHKERRAKVRQLKHDRDQEIIETKRDFYNKAHAPRQYNNNNNNQGSQNQPQSASPNQNYQNYQNN